jgi:hypothetical protein
MKLRPLLWLLSILPLVLCFCRPLGAQTTSSGGLTGVVSDPSGAIISNANVEIRDEAKGTSRSTKTDQEGVYRFLFLAPSRYTLTVSHEGFRNERRTVNVLLGPPVSANVTLELAKTNVTVTVTAESPLIQTENGDYSATMNQKQISEVPNPGNDLTYIAQTAPGVVMNTDQQGSASFSILGMPGTSNLFTVNGMKDNDNYFNLSPVGPLGLLLGQNQIQEATIVSIGYSGQFGGAAGGNINYITKSGSNEIHGNAQYYWNGRVFNANDWFNKALGVPRPFEIADQWAGSLGGPIKKNKLFFFFDTEGLRLVNPELIPVTIPSLQFENATIANIVADPRFGAASATAAFYKDIFALYNAAPGASTAPTGSFTDPLGCTGFIDQTSGLGITAPCARHFNADLSVPSQDTVTSGQVDWNVGKDDRAFLRVQHEKGQYSFGVDPISSVFNTSGNSRWWEGQVVETHTFGSLGASQFLLGGRYSDAITQLEHPAQAVAAFPTTLSFVASNTFFPLGEFNNSAFPQGTPETQFQISEDLVKIWGKQKFGLGASFDRTYWTNFGYAAFALGLLFPQTLRAFFEGGVDPTSPLVDFTQLDQSFALRTSERIAFYNLGLYGQDEWQARPNLTLTLALRAEHQSNPVCALRCFARMAGAFNSVSHDPEQPYNQAILIDQKQALPGMDDIVWSPRFSFAWQPIGVSRNTVIRGGFGILYDSLPDVLADWLSSNPPLYNAFTVVGGNLTPNETNSLFSAAAASNAAFVEGFNSGETLAQIQAAVLSVNSLGFFPPGMVVPRDYIHSPQYQRWSLEWQQAFGVGTSLSLTYTGSHGLHELVTNGSANAFGFGSLPPGLCASPPVPPCADPRFSEVADIASDAVSSYNGLVVSFEHRFTRFGQGLFQGNYTYGHALDEVSDGGILPFTSVSVLSPQDPNNLRGAYGPAEYDVRHSFNANYVWEIPAKAALKERGLDLLVDGWQVSGTIFARTGFPYTVIDYAESVSLAANNYAGLLYAVPVGPLGPGPSCGEGAAFPIAAHPCQPPQLLADGVTPNPDARFIQSGCETGFNTGYLPGPSGPCGGPIVSFAQGRNRFRGPGYFNTDFAITKRTHVPGWNNATLGIGFQFFNFFNHPNFGFPDNWISDQTFGQIQYLEQSPTSIIGSGIGEDAAPRMIQLKVQLQF